MLLYYAVRSETSVALIERGKIMNEIYWILPVLFIFHDFEEIIFMERWVKRLDREKLYERLPVNLVKKILRHFDNISTTKFAMSVYILYIMLIVCTFISYLWNLKLFWTSIFIFFTIHLFIHCLQSIFWGGYIPAVFTSIICIPICLWILKFVFTKFHFSLFSISFMTLIVAIVALFVLCGLHKIMEA